MTCDTSEIVARVYDLPGRATRAIVDLDAITQNVRHLRANQRQAQGLMAVVKANGYGHGAAMSAQSALEGGADRIGVATVGEAAELRRSRIDVPILVLGPVDPTEIDRALECGAELTVGSRSFLDAAEARAEASGRDMRVHVKVDTGMHRFGAMPEDAVNLVDLVAGHDRIQLAGIMTHLATADDPHAFAGGRQLSVFRELSAAVRDRLTHDTMIHASNSAASIQGLFPEGSLCRVGIAIYGLRPGSAVGLLEGMRPALSLLTRLARDHAVELGDGVSYGHTYVANDTERVGLLPTGYADGYSRSLSNLAWVRVGGAVCPVRGRVCMDQTVVGRLPDSAVEGELVGLLGPMLDGPSADEMAGWAGTVNYEIVAGLTARIPRYYVRDGRVVATLIEGRLDQV